MTFLIDPPLLILFGFVSYLIDDKVGEKTKFPIARILALFSGCTIIFTSSTLYLNMWFMDWFWQPFSPTITSGRDLMINSGIFSFESDNTAGLIDALAFVQIALYPLWIYIGIQSHHRYMKRK